MKVVVAVFYVVKRKEGKQEPILSETPVLVLSSPSLLTHTLEENGKLKIKEFTFYFTLKPVLNCHWIAFASTTIPY